MGYSLEDFIFDNVEEGKEEIAIYEVKTALINQIIKHSNIEIHEQLNWVKSNTSRDEIFKVLIKFDYSIYDLLLILSNIANSEGVGDEIIAQSPKEVKYFEFQELVV